MIPLAAVSMRWKLVSAAVLIEGAALLALLRNGTQIALPVLALATVALLFAVFVLTRRLSRLAGTAERLAAGAAETSSGPAGDDEVGRLAAILDQMAAENRRQAAALRAAEQRLHGLISISADSSIWTRQTPSDPSWTEE